MSVGTSGRIVIEVDPMFKQMLYSQLEQDGLTLKEWFLSNALNYVGKNASLPLFPMIQNVVREKKK